MNESVVRIKNEIISELDDILKSPRWDNQNTPFPGTITELWERVNDRDSYNYFRYHAGGRLLLDIIELTEEAFNDDWLPFEIIGLELGTYREFLAHLLKELPHIDTGESESMIKRIHRQFKESI